MFVVSFDVIPGDLFPCSNIYTLGDQAEAQGDVALDLLNHVQKKKSSRNISDESKIYIKCVYFEPLTSTQPVTT